MLSHPTGVTIFYNLLVFVFYFITQCRFFWTSGTFLLDYQRYETSAEQRRHAWYLVWNPIATSDPLELCLPYAAHKLLWHRTMASTVDTTPHIFLCVPWLWILASLDALFR